LALHEKAVQDMWRGSLRGPAAARYLRALLASSAAEPARRRGRRTGLAAAE
jgi:hypothetical protein